MAWSVHHGTAPTATPIETSPRGIPTQCNPRYDFMAFNVSTTRIRSECIALSLINRWNRALPSRQKSRWTSPPAVADPTIAVGWSSTNASTNDAGNRSSSSQSKPLKIAFAASNRLFRLVGSKSMGIGNTGQRRNVSLNSMMLVSKSCARLTARRPALSLSNSPTNRYLGRPFRRSTVRATARRLTNSRTTARVPPCSPTPTAETVNPSSKRSTPVMFLSYFAASTNRSSSVVPSTRTVRGRTRIPSVPAYRCTESGSLSIYSPLNLEGAAVRGRKNGPLCPKDT